MLLIYLKIKKHAFYYFLEAWGERKVLSFETAVA